MAEKYELLVKDDRAVILGGVLPALARVARARTKRWGPGELRTEIIATHPQVYELVGVSVTFRLRGKTPGSVQLTLAVLNRNVLCPAPWVIADDRRWEIVRFEAWEQPPPEAPISAPLTLDGCLEYIPADEFPFYNPEPQPICGSVHVIGAKNGPERFIRVNPPSLGDEADRRLAESGLDGSELENAKRFLAAVRESAPSYTTIKSFAFTDLDGYSSAQKRANLFLAFEQSRIAFERGYA